MTNEEPVKEEADELAEAIVEAVEDERSTLEDEDAFSKKERQAELDKEQERIRRAKELRKQLRRRELGLLYYRWPAAVLLLSGILAIFTEFLVIWVQEEPVYGFNSFWEAFVSTTPSSIFWLFPLISGVVMITLAFFAYSRPKTTFVAIIPAMMMVMSGSQVYFLVTAAHTAAYLAGVPIEFYFAATGTPIQMVVVGLLGLLAIAIREKE